MQCYGSWSARPTDDPTFGIVVAVCISIVVVVAIVALTVESIKNKR